MTPRCFPFGIDLEPWRQVGATYDSQNQLIHDNDSGLRILEGILREHKTRATFFVFASWARKHPVDIRRLVLSGHEIASRGMNDENPARLGPIEFVNEISDARKILEDLSGMPVVGYRVPQWALTPELPWALPSIQRAGYLYDASLTSRSKYFTRAGWKGAKQGLVLDGSPGQRFGFFISPHLNLLFLNSRWTLGRTIRWLPTFLLHALMEGHEGQFKGPMIVDERDFRPSLKAPQARLGRLLGWGRPYRFCDVIEDTKKKMDEKQEY